MTPDRSWVVASKDLAEFRRNRTILIQLALMPLVMAVFIPLGLLAPLAFLATLDPTLEGPPPAPPAGITTVLNDPFLNDTVVRDRRVLGGNLVRVFVSDSIIENATLVDCTVHRSYLVNVTMVGGSARDSTAVDTEFAAVNLAEVHQYFTQPGADPDLFLLQLLGNTMLLMLVSIATVVPVTLAAHSFVGEKVQRTMEPLLATPLRDPEILRGKILAVVLPSITVVLVSAALMSMTSLLVLGEVGLAQALLNPAWFIAILLTCPLLTLVVALGMVAISARVTDVRVAQQYGALVVTPVTFLFMFPIMSSTLGSAGDPTNMTTVLAPGPLLTLAATLAIANLIVYRIAVRSFDRERILTQWK